MAPESRPTPSIAHMPVSLFASVMGMGGLAVAWRRAADVFNVSPEIGKTLTWVALAVFAVGILSWIALLPLVLGLLLAQIPELSKAPMGPANWAYTFPLAALTVALLADSAATGWWGVPVARSGLPGPYQRGRGVGDALHGALDRHADAPAPRGRPGAREGANAGELRRPGCSNYLVTSYPAAVHAGMPPSRPTVFA